MDIAIVERSGIDFAFILHVTRLVDRVVPLQAVDIPDVVASVEVVVDSDVGDVLTEDVSDVSDVSVVLGWEVELCESGVVLAVVCDVDESSVVLVVIGDVEVSVLVVVAVVAVVVDGVEVEVVAEVEVDVSVVCVEVELVVVGVDAVVSVVDRVVSVVVSVVVVSIENSLGKSERPVESVGHRRALWRVRDIETSRDSVVC
jgi:hypothetical protein